MSRIKTFISALSVLLAAALPAEVIMKLDFDKGFNSGNLPLNGKVSGVSWRSTSDPHSFALVKTPAASKPHALKILRDGSSGRIVFSPPKAIAPMRNYSMQFKVYLVQGDGTVLHFHNGKQLLGGIHMASGSVMKAYNINQGWENNEGAPELPLEQWVAIRVNFDVNRGFYTIDTALPGGKIHNGTTQFPFIVPGPVNEWHFLNILPQKNYAFVDDLLLTCDDSISLSGRTDFAPECTSGNAAFNRMLSGKAVWAVENKVIDIDVPSARLEAIVFKAAPGKKLPANVSIKALNAGGHWIDLKTLMISKSGSVEFSAIDQITKLQLFFPSAAGCTVAGMGLYSPPATPQGELDKDWGKKLDAEYRLPVYDMQYEGCDTAQLGFVNHTDSPLKVKIVLHERLTDKHFRTIDHTLAPGLSHMEFDLKEFPNGEYLTTIIDRSASRGGQIVRLLRHHTSAPCSAVPRTEITGQKILFPDGFYLAEYDNIRFTTGQGKNILIRQGTTDDDTFILHGENFGVLPDGRMAINASTMNRMWQAASRKPFHAIADANDPTKWTIGDGYVPMGGKNPARVSLPEAARPDWDKKPGADGKIKYRMYDPETDGPVNIKQLYCEFISFAGTDHFNHKDQNWGVLKPKRSSVWTVWYRSPGEALIVGKKALVDGFPDSGALEPPNSGSDLGFGQWLSDDGKTLFFGWGRHLMRYKPYVAPFDNLHDRARIIAVWRTTDGINWEQSIVAPPDADKPVADQHYGAASNRVANGAGLMYSILHSYNAMTQQIDWEAIYSWDGFRWTRFQKEPKLMKNGPVGHFNHGGGYIMPQIVEKDGKHYLFQKYLGSSYHFEAEFLQGHSPNLDHITGDYLKKRLESRQLHSWPYFAEYYDSSWEKLAEHIKSCFYALAVIEYRKDGLFYAVADDQDAKMLTRPLTARNGLKMNTVIRDGGYLKVALVDESGKVIPGFEKEFGPADDTELKIFDQLPEGKFQIRLNLKNTEVYSLNF